MAKTTTNLGLIKPERSDNYSVDVMSGNMDIIDAKIAALEAGEFETVNCTGAITADSVNGVVLKSSGTITVTPISTVAGHLPYYETVQLLPPRPGITYTGSITFKASKNNYNLNYYTSAKKSASLITVSTSGSTLNFSDIRYLIVNHYDEASNDIQYYDFTLT